QGSFVGDNRSSGAPLTFWILPPEKKEGKDKPKPPKEKIKIQIVNATGDTIRNFTRKPKWGMNRISWNLRRNGVDLPSRRERKADADPNSGSRVLPGTYRVVMTYGNFTGTTTLTVHPDPRRTSSAGMYDQREAMVADLDSTIVHTTAAWGRLREARKSIDRVKGILVHAESAVKDSLQKHAKELVKRIDELEEIVMEPADQKGIQRNPTNLRAKLFSARGYIGQIEGAPSQMAKVSLEQFKLGAGDFIDAVNGFLSQDLAPFKEEVEAAELPLFGDLDPVDKN
ncbi:MAG: hypothetical protein AAFU67_17990, partial [Bacteroidota bacterium]